MSSERNVGLQPAPLHNRMIPLLDAAAVDAALPMDTCIAAMTEALCAVDAGTAIQPVRTVVALPDGAGSLYTMPAFTASPRALAVKLITIFHGNAERGLPTHQGVVVLFDADTGSPRLLIDAARLTAIRTAAVSAVATNALARRDAADLAVLGTGVQARAHVAAMRAVRPIRRVRIWGRTAAHAERLARELGADVECAATARDAVEGADIICTTTAAREPVLHGAWLSDGVHINAIGASTRTTRELDGAAVASCRIFVDSRAAAAVEAGDLLSAHDAGSIGGPETWTQIGAVLRGVAPGRTHGGERTLFKSLGLAAEDAAAAALVARSATL